jgi:hypothetical protein
MSVWDDPKIKYLYEFEAAVATLLGGYQPLPSGLRDGLWTNAHMWHGIGLDVDLAAVRFVLDVVARYHPHLLADQSLASQPPSDEDAVEPLDAFTEGYVVCALWASCDESTPSGGEPLDRNYEATDIAPESLKRIKADCREFQREYSALLAQAYALYSVTDGASPEAYAGHDLWLTRNSHGSGYWNRDLGEVGEKLTTAAHVAGTCDIYVGDDGQLYI